MINDQYFITAFPITDFERKFNIYSPSDRGVLIEIDDDIEYRIAMTEVSPPTNVSPTDWYVDKKCTCLIHKVE
ncbi:MAG: hypothetical protein BV459_04950 [Thermoplasmata archaeon M11B2D]|nr:MAG: hypothetical protein BV459_04950 [Thermoplasmata archaeon M11B2D]